MAKRKPKKMWVYSPPKPAKPKAPESIQIEVEKKCNELVETVLKPKFIQPPPKDSELNYLVDIYTKWHRNYFYFYAKYHCPGPYSIAPYFETGFARLEYAGDNKFNLNNSPGFTVFQIGFDRLADINFIHQIIPGRFWGVVLLSQQSF